MNMSNQRDRIVCAECNKEIPIGSPLIMLDRGSVISEAGSPCYAEHLPRALCSKPCATRALSKTKI
jgi:hypothetical protein